MTFGVLGSTLATSRHFLGHDSIHDGRFIIGQDIPLNIGGSVTEAVTYEVFHRLPLPVLMRIRLCPGFSASHTSY